MTSRSVAHTAIASTRTSTSDAPGCGSSFSTSPSSPGLPSTQACILPGITGLLAALTICKSPCCRKFSIRAAEGIVAAHVIGVGLCRIAVDQRPRVERMAQAAHLVLDREERLAAAQVDDVA